MLVIAPLDANTMAKLANGICDNLLVKYFIIIILLKMNSSSAMFEILYTDVKLNSYFYI